MSNLENWRKTGQVGGTREAGNCFGYARARLGLDPNASPNDTIGPESLDPHGKLKRVDTLSEAVAVGVTHKDSDRLQHIVVVEGQGDTDNPQVSHRWARGHSVRKESLNRAVSEYDQNRGGQRVYYGIVEE